MIKKVKVSVEEGVYVHNSGNLLTVNFGTVAGEPAIKTTGVSRDGKEVTRVVCIEDNDPALAMFAQIVHESEYLGEL